MYTYHTHAHTHTRTHTHAHTHTHTHTHTHIIIPIYTYVQHMHTSQRTPGFASRSIDTLHISLYMQVRVHPVSRCIYTLHTSAIGLPMTMKGVIYVLHIHISPRRPRCALHPHPPHIRHKSMTMKGHTVYVHPRNGTHQRGAFECRIAPTRGRLSPVAALEPFCFF